MSLWKCWVFIKRCFLKILTNVEQITNVPRWRTSSSSRVGVSKASVFRFVSRTVCSPASQPTAIKLFQSLLYGSGTVFRSISHLFRHFPSSALAWRHTSSNSVTRNYCRRAREVTLSFMDMLIALTYLEFIFHPTCWLFIRLPDLMQLSSTWIYHNSDK